jgi:hypothetical protein
MAESLLLGTKISPPAGLVNPLFLFPRTSVVFGSPLSYN